MNKTPYPIPPRRHFPPMTDAEFSSLKADIKANGLHEAIWLCDGKVLDGRHRQAACIELGVEPRYRHFEGDEAAALAFVIALNIKRRQLTASQLAAIALDIEKYEAELAQRRMLAGVKVDPMATLPEGSPGNARDKAAAAVGVSPRYVQTAKQVAAADPALAEQVKAGTKTLPQAQRELKKAENEALKAANPIVIPQGKHACIVIDPPWPMKKIERDVRPNQVAFDYPTMDEAALATCDVAGMAADDCHLFCWTTQKFLPLALRLLDAWGFRYVLTMVWHKPGGFQPIGLPQYNCEFALYARRGSPEFVDTLAFVDVFEKLGIVQPAGEVARRAFVLMGQECRNYE